MEPITDDEFSMSTDPYDWNFKYSTMPLGFVFNPAEPAPMSRWSVIRLHVGVYLRGVWAALCNR